MLGLGMPGGAEWIVISLMCALPLIAIAVIVYVVLRLTRKYSGDRETRCRKCGYILRGISEPRCPECGERV